MLLFKNYSALLIGEGFPGSIVLYYFHSIDVAYFDILSRSFYAGVLMENEIPQGLEIIGKGVEQSLSRCTRFSMKRILLPALLRLCVGYMFLVNLFVAVAQSSSVINMFYDILALEFVENIDDVIFGLSNRGEINSPIPLILTIVRETY
jgi:hypothetical protein